MSGVFIRAPDQDGGSLGVGEEREREKLQRSPAGMNIAPMSSVDFSRSRGSAALFLGCLSGGT